MPNLVELDCADYNACYYIIF